MILADPDGQEICFVGKIYFCELLYTRGVYSAQEVFFPPSFFSKKGKMKKSMK